MAEQVCLCGQTFALSRSTLSLSISLLAFLYLRKSVLRCFSREVMLSFFSFSRAFSCDSRAANSDWDWTNLEWSLGE